MPLPALILSQPVEGLRGADCHVHRPAVAILVDDGGGTERQIGGEKGFEGWERLSLPKPCGGVFAFTSQHHDPHEAPRQHRVPQAIPGLALRARFAGVGRPPRGGLYKGLGRAEQVAFFARGAATLWRRRGRYGVELGTARQTPDHMGRLRPPTDRGLGGIAPISQAPDGPPGPLLGQAIADITGPLTSGTIRHVAGGGVGGVRESASPTGTLRLWPGHRGRGMDMRPHTQCTPRSVRYAGRAEPAPWR